MAVNDEVRRRLPGRSRPNEPVIVLTGHVVAPFDRVIWVDPQRDWWQWYRSWLDFPAGRLLHDMAGLVVLNAIEDLDAAGVAIDADEIARV
jgi:hypothetical protein